MLSAPTRERMVTMDDLESDAVNGEPGARRSPDKPTGSPDAAYGPMIVCLDGRERDGDALALGVSLARALGTTVSLAHVVPSGPPGRGMNEYEAIKHNDGQRLLAQIAKKVGPEIETQLIGPGSAPRGLAKLGRQHANGILVLGSSHRGAVGRIVPGGVASQLLTCAPCPIAVAPVGYKKQRPGAITSIGVAYDGTSESDVALATAAHAAATLKVPLRMYHAMHAVSDDPAWDKFREYIRQYAQGILDRGLERIPAGIEATTRVLEGDVATVIADAAREDHVGLLYVGSRGYGPVREALFGGVAGALLQTARCPLVIIPRGVRGAAAPQPDRGFAYDRSASPEAGFELVEGDEPAAGFAFGEWEQAVPPKDS